MHIVSEGSTCSDLDSLKLYLRDVKELDLLPYDETIELIKKAKLGDKNARNKVVEHNLKLIVVIAKKHQGKGVPFLDLIEYGNMALIKAIKNYKLTSKTRFNIYLSVFIDLYIRKMIAKDDRVVQYGNNTYSKVGQIKKFCDNFLIKNEREATDEEIRKSLNVKQEIIDLYRATLDNSLVISYDDVPKDDSNENRSIMESVGSFDKNYDYVLDKIAYEQITNGINNIKFKEHEKEILLKRYGIIDGKVHTLRDLSKEFPLSPEGIRLKEVSALKRVKNSKISKW